MKLITLFLFFLLSQSFIAQDTIQFYSRIVPIAIYPDTGSFKNHTYQYLEGGISWGAVDAGLSFGKLSDNEFLGVKINMDASQMGNFSNEFGIGGGWVFNGSLLLETQYTIMMRLNHYLNTGLSVNYIDISNKDFRNQYVIYGIFIRLGLSRDSNGNIDTSLRIPKKGVK
jgi:hypothetical protein